MIWQLVGLGVVLALNNAMAAVALGTEEMGRWTQLRIAMLFALFEACMPVLGLFVGKVLANAIGTRAHFLGIIILALTGLYGLIKRDRPESEKKQSARAKTLFYAVILSLDNMAVGFSLGLFSVPVVAAAIVFGSVSLLLTFAGLEVGRLMRRRMKLSPDKFTGAVLLATACVMLFV